MNKKLSKVQREVLNHMVQGHALYTSRHGRSWLDRVPGPGQNGLYKRVHGSTLYALRKRGYIDRLDTARTPWWRRDYVITDDGRDALDT